ncbi:MAG: hypothetical protein F6K56_14600 [Moorea sp. SIO3G5]|nr:hypothetical protein [Moorena sp. SIO3G5]
MIIPKEEKSWHLQELDFELEELSDSSAAAVSGGGIFRRFSIERSTATGRFHWTCDSLTDGSGIPIGGFEDTRKEARKAARRSCGTFL